VRDRSGRADIDDLWHARGPQSTRALHACCRFPRSPRRCVNSRSRRRAHDRARADRRAAAARDGHPGSTMTSLPSLEAALRCVAPSTTAPEALAACLTAPDGVLLGRLIDAFTVKETFLLPPARGSSTRIDWPTLLGAGTRAGSERVTRVGRRLRHREEAYTPRRSASDAFRTVTPPVRILGTDISAAAIEQARRGPLRQPRPACDRRRYPPAPLPPDADGVVVGAGLAGDRQLPASTTSPAIIRRHPGRAR